MPKRNDRITFTKTVLKAEPGLIQNAPRCNRLVSWKIVGKKLEVLCTGNSSAKEGCNFALVPLDAEAPAGFGWNTQVGTYRGRPALLFSDCIANF
jgi:hypothetical protein